MRVGLLFNSLALRVGITHLYTAAHYPRDVLAGAIPGSAWGVLTTVVEGYAGFGGVR
jgi:membrane-associated phospholipid phosphatase